MLCQIAWQMQALAVVPHESTYANRINGIVDVCSNEGVVSLRTVGLEIEVEQALRVQPCLSPERDFFMDNLLVRRIHSSSRR